MEFKMLINGKLVDSGSGKTTVATNPATGEEIASFPVGDVSDVEKAVAAAKQAFPVWSRMLLMERTRILGTLADSLVKAVEELGRLECLDHGFPIKTALHFASVSGLTLKNYAELSTTVLGTADGRNSNALINIQHEPIGVCALITPWNVPLMMAVGKMAACLATGNTCVIKPPTTDSLSTLKLGEILAESELPPGAVNIVSGPGGTLGEALAAHPDVGMVSFTGSSEVGKRIMELGSRNVKRLSLELGGKNPFIVLEDADVDAAVHCGVHSSFFNSGQVCASPGRYYLHAKVHDEFVAKFKATAQKIVVGDTQNPETQMGTVVNEEHRDKVEGYIKSGIESGAKLVLGGQRPTTPPLDKGSYVMPTVFTGVEQYMKIAREEIFGPVACIMTPFTSEEKVIELANDNIYGLSASVWSCNQTKAIKMANKIEAGTVWINEHMLIRDIPWGGFKESGFGKEHGTLGLEEYTQIKTICADLTEMKHRPWNEF